MFKNLKSKISEIAASGELAASDALAQVAQGMSPLRPMEDGVG